MAAPPPAPKAPCRPAPPCTPRASSCARCPNTPRSFIEEEAALLFRNRQPGTFHHLQEIFPNHAFRSVRLVAQNVARMIGNHERLPRKLAPLAANLAQRLERAEAEQ